MNKNYKMLVGFVVTFSVILGLVFSFNIKNISYAETITIPTVGVKSVSGPVVIKNLQAFLNWNLTGKITPLKVDGKWGANTIKAIKIFQASNVLKADGSFGKASAAKAISIIKSSNIPPVLPTDTTIVTPKNPTTDGISGITIPDKGIKKGISSIEAIKNLQAFLNWNLGKSLAVDGIWGASTTNAIKEYQANNGLTPDGTFGPQSAVKAITILANQKENIVCKNGMTPESNCTILPLIKTAEVKLADIIQTVASNSATGSGTSGSSGSGSGSSSGGGSGSSGSGSSGSGTSGNGNGTVPNLPSVSILIPDSLSSSITDTNETSYQVAGSCSIDGQPVNISVVGDATITASPLCTSSAYLANLNLSNLGDGDIAITVTQKNTLGASLSPATVTSKKHTSVPVVTITAPISTTPITNSNRGAYSISGSCSEKGQPVNISAINGTVLTYSTTCSTSSTYSITPDLSSLGDGSVKITTSQTNLFGISSTANVTVTKNTSIPTVSITVPTTTTTITNSNKGAYTVSGSCSVNGQAVIISAVGGATTIPSSAACGSANNLAPFIYSSSMNLSSLPDGNVAITVNHSNIYGSSATPVTVTVVKNTSTPTVTISSSVASTPITNLNKTAYTVSGTCTAVGQVVNITATNGATVPATPNCTASGFTTSMNLSTLADGSVLITATHANSVGNSVSTNTTVTKNTSVPTVTISTPATITNTNQSSYTVSGSCSVNGRNVDISVSGNSSVTASALCGGVGNVTPLLYTTAAMNLSNIADGNISITANHSNTFGNAAIPAVASVTKNTVVVLPTPTVTITAPASTTAITNLNKTAYSFSGTCSVSGQPVNISANGVTVSSPSCASGVYSTSLNLVSVADGSVAFVVTHANTAGTTATANVTVTKDTSIPTVTIAVPTSTTAITNSNKSAYTVSGSCSVIGQVVSIAVTGGSTASPVCASLAYSFSMNLSSVADGSVTITVNHANTFGSSAIPATVTVTKDTSIPTVTIAVPTATTAITNSNKSSYAVSGSCSVNNQPVNITVNSVAMPATTCNSGSYNTSLNLTSVADGSVTIVVSHSNTYGANITANVNVTKNTSIPTVSITSTNPITISNKSSYIVSGSCSANGQAVNINAGGVTATATCTTSLNYTTAGMNLSNVPDGNVTITANHSNIYGSAAVPASVSVIKDTSTPTVTITTPASSTAITNTNKGAYTISGSCSVNTQPVVISISGTTIASPTCSGGSYNSSPNLTSIADGSVNIVVTHTNTFGASTTANVTVTKNTSIPTISYTGSPFTFTNGTAITTITPTLGGGVTSVSINPSLTTDTGLSFNTTTGVISGTPTAVHAATTYTVTAANAIGTTATATISVTVNASSTGGSTYYVATNGSNSNAGTLASPWQTITYAVGTSSPAKAGDTIYVKAGLYSETTIVFKKDNISLIGYKATPGDNPAILANAADPFTAFTSTEQPLIDGGNRTVGTGINVQGRTGVTIKNIAIRNFAYGLLGGKAPASTVTGNDPVNLLENLTLDNVSVSTVGGTAAGSYSGIGIGLGSMSTKFSNGDKVTNSLVVNSAAEGVTFNGDNNLGDNIKVYCNETTDSTNAASTDYYITIIGSNNTIKNSYAKKIPGVTSGEHGFSLKSNAEQVVDQGSNYAPINPQYNTLTNNTVVNIGEGFVVRHRGVQYNTFTNNTSIGTHTGVSGSSGGMGNGITIRDGASNNTFTNTTISNTYSAITIQDTVEDGGTTGHPGMNNIIDGSVITNSYIGVYFNSYSVASDAGANIIKNTKFDKVRTMFEVARNATQMQYINDIFNGTLPTTAQGVFREGTYATDVIPSQFTSCTFTNIEGGLPAGFTATTAATYYVATTGSDTNAGTLAAPWKTIAYAVGSSSAAKSGDTIYVKAGAYSGNVVFQKDNLTVLGYKTTPGDAPAILANTLAPADPKAPISFSGFSTTEMPVLNGGNRATGTGIYINHKIGITIKNISITNYAYGLTAGNTSQDASGNYLLVTTPENLTLYNVNVATVGDITSSYSGLGISLGSMSTSFSNNDTVTNSLIINAAAEGLTMNGNYNTADNVKVYCNDTDSSRPTANDQNAATDYYIMVTGSNNIVKNSLVNRLPNLWHTGHGFTIKDNAQNVVDGPTPSKYPVISPQNNTFTNNIAYDMGEGFVVRHRQVKNNTFTGNYAYGTYDPATYTTSDGYGNGITIRDGASNNTFTNTTMVGLNEPISFSDSTEDGGTTGYENTGNIIDGAKVTDTYFGIVFNYDTSGVMSNAGANTIKNSTFTRSRYMFYVSRPATKMSYINDSFGGTNAMTPKPGGYFYGSTYKTDVVPAQFTSSTFTDIEGGVPAGFTGSSSTPTVTITTPTAGSTISTLAQATSYVVSGACSVNGQPVNINAVGGASVPSAPTCTSLAYTATLNLSGLTNGNVTITVTHANAAGTSATTSVVVTKNVVAANSITAASCSRTDVQAALTSAADGYTVNIPAGSCDWGSSAAVTRSAGVWLKGAGKGLTTIKRSAPVVPLPYGGVPCVLSLSYDANNNVVQAPCNGNPAPEKYLVQFDCSNGKSVEVSGISFLGNDDLQTEGQRVIDQDSGLALINNCRDFKIHDSEFKKFSDSGLDIRGNSRGVVYLNDFISNFKCQDKNTIIPVGDGTNWKITGPISCLGYGIVVYGDGTWPALTLGTQDAVFIEDNNMYDNRHAVASNNGSKYVVRWNNIDHTERARNFGIIDAHGKGSSTHGSRSYEIYDNILIDNTTTHNVTGIGIRGGDGVIFDNTISTGFAWPFSMSTETTCTAATYPIPEQIKALYSWGNHIPGSTTAPTTPFNISNTACIHQNQDFFMTPLPGYTPYTYPHPLKSTALF